MFHEGFCSSISNTIRVYIRLPDLQMVGKQLTLVLASLSNRHFANTQYDGSDNNEVGRR